MSSTDSPLITDQPDTQPGSYPDKHVLDRLTHVAVTMIFVFAWTWPALTLAWPAVALLAVYMFGWLWWASA